MIVATRPEPTVRPPSRYWNGVFLRFFFILRCKNPLKYAVFYTVFLFARFLGTGTLNPASSQQTEIVYFKLLPTLDIFPYLFL